MITVIILSGPHKGKSREISSNVEPGNLLGELVGKDWRWRIDFRQATPDEAFLWGREDLVCRIIAALVHGRAVWFEGVKYRTENRSEALTIAGVVEDAIVNSGKMVFVESDDETGVKIGTGGTEHKIQ